MELFALVLAIATLASAAAAADPAVNSGGLTPDLAKWLSQRESPAKISAKIAQDVFPGMGFGLKAEEAVVANETLMEVPASALLSMKTASEGKLKGVVEELNSAAMTEAGVTMDELDDSDSDYDVDERSLRKRQEA